MGNGHALEIYNSLVTLSDYKNWYKKQWALHHDIFYTFFNSRSHGEYFVVYNAFKVCLSTLRSKVRINHF